MQLTLHPISAYHYAKDAFKRPWLEAEHIIATNECASFYYARDVIKGRFLLGEPVIAKHVPTAFLYADVILKGRWLEAEPIIATNPEWACKYAEEIIKGRWPEAEPVIAIIEVDHDFNADLERAFDTVFEEVVLVQLRRCQRTQAAQTRDFVI